MSESVDEVHQALANAVRTAVMAGSQIAEIIAARRAEEYRRAQHASRAETQQTAARLRAEREAAMPVMRQPWNEKWWRSATPEQIADTYQVSAGWAGDGDPYAQATAHRMREQIHTRYQVTLPASHLPAHDLAALLTAEAQHPDQGPKPGPDTARVEPARGTSREDTEDGLGAVAHDDTAAAAQQRQADGSVPSPTAEADQRDRDTNLEGRASTLRNTLDEGWWNTAHPEEIGGVWEHVAGWPEGTAKSETNTLLRENIHRLYGIDPADTASGAEVAARVTTALGERLREKAAAQEAAADTAHDTASPTSAIPTHVAAAESAHGEQIHTAAEQDRAAAAALENLADQEAAAAVGIAAEGFSQTPSSRLTNRAKRHRGASRSPRSAGRQRDPGLGR